MERANSSARRNALYRTKSTSSVHTSTSPSAAKDLVTRRLQAEAAACEAFRRSQELERLHEMHSAVVSNKSQRRNKLEGSHFEDARLGRRKSMASTAANRRTQLGRLDSQRQHTRSSPGYTHARANDAVVPPTNLSYATKSQHSRLTHYVLPATHKITTVTAQGSPTPRRKPVPPSVSSTPPPVRHVQEFSYEVGPNSELLSVVDRSNTSEPPTQPLADSSSSQQDNVRNRKSFLLGSVQKLRKRSSAVHSKGAFNQDKSVPPFNFADQGLTFPPPSVDDGPHIAHIEPAQTGKKRFLSFAVKDRFKHFIKRTPSNAQGDLPPQHIQAKQAHYVPDGSTSSSQRTNVFQRQSKAS